MKTLNFYPYYEPYLVAMRKTTTFRLHQPNFRPGEAVQLTAGWDEKNCKNLHKAMIESVYTKSINELTPFDFEGESPDCKDPEATALVLSSIYREIVRLDEKIWVVKFSHLRH